MTTKTPYEVACAKIKWDADGNPDHLPVPLASDMTKFWTSGRHTAWSLGVAISQESGHTRHDLHAAYRRAYRRVHSTLWIVSHNRNLPTNAARASAVDAAFTEMGLTERS